MISATIASPQNFNSSFPKRVKRHSKKNWTCNANAKLGYYVLEKSFSHMNKRIYMYILMKSTFLKYDFRTWHVLLQPRFLDWCFTRFGKELFMFCFSSVFIPLNNMFSVLRHWSSSTNDNCHYTVNNSVNIIQVSKQKYCLAIHLSLTSTENNNKENRVPKTCTNYAQV